MNEIKKEITALSKSLEFSLNDSELEKIIIEFNSIKDSLSIVKKVNIKDIEPTLFVHEIDLSSDLTNDIETTYDQSEVFSNSKYFNKGFVEIKNEK